MRLHGMAVDAGLDKVLIVNGHGGNAAPCRAVSWQVAEEDIFTLTFNWWDIVEDELRQWSATSEGVGHAGEWETAVQLHLRAHLIAQQHIVKDDTGTKPFAGALAPLDPRAVPAYWSSVAVVASCCRRRACLNSSVRCAWRS